MAGKEFTESSEKISVSRVGAWKNKAEFQMVYEWMFGANSDADTKQLAAKRMKIWKIRRMNLTPASVLATLSVLEAQLKDRPNTQLAITDLQAIYSDAFTRFLNYMSSIIRGRRLDSMYSTARELGIDSFFVDLRHLCAHGQVVPSLSVFRRSADYCLHWLRDFYWDRERQFIVDATVRDVHLPATACLAQMVGEWFGIYDVATEAMILGCKTTDDCQQTDYGQQLDVERLAPLLRLSEEVHNKKLTFLSVRAINELAVLSASTDRDRGNAHVYCDLMIDLPYFFRRSAQYYRSKLDKPRFVGLHQNLFRLFAMCDYINAIFERLIAMCEDESEDETNRKAASFWCLEIVTGFAVFKQFKAAYKAKKERKSDFDLEKAPINTEVMADELKQIYKQLNVNCYGTLIFGDTARRPWALHFDRDFLLDRCFNINVYTVATVKKSIPLTEPTLQPADAQRMEKLISIYMGEDAAVPAAYSADGDNKVYTIQDLPESAIAGGAVEERNGQAAASIWRLAPEGLDWKSCPLGSTLP